MKYFEDTDEWVLEESDGKAVTLSVTVPGIPLNWSAQDVADWLYSEVGHPVDSGYEAMVEVSVVSETPHGTDVREGNGCMIYGKEEAGGE